MVSTYVRHKPGIEQTSVIISDHYKVLKQAHELSGFLAVHIDLINYAYRENHSLHLISDIFINFMILTKISFQIRRNAD